MALYQDTSALSDSGASQSPTWTLLTTVSCAKRDVSGREAFAGGQDLMEMATTRFVIRWRSDLMTAATRTQLRATVEGLNYDITHVAEMGRREGIEILAVRRGAEN